MQVETCVVEILCLHFMKNIGRILLIILSMLLFKSVSGQSVSAELTSMESFWAFSGSFGAKLTRNGRLNFSNTSRISSDYPGDEEMRMLILSNVGYSITPNLKSTVGEMYSNSSGLQPTVGLQYMVSKKRWQWMLFPNLNISRRTDLMNISMVQCLRGLSEKMKFVFRMQSLSILNAKGHAFSTLRFRSGFVRGRYQFGAAADLNFFDRNFEFAKCFGLFFQYKLL